MNDAARMRPVMATFNALAEELGAAVLLISHDRKDGSDVAGSHVIRAAAKTLWHLARPQTKRPWSNEEDRDDGRRVLSVVSKMTSESRHLLHLQGAGAWRYIGQGNSSKEARMAWAQDTVFRWLQTNEEGTAEEIAKATETRKQDVYASLTVLNEQGGVGREERKGKTGRPRQVYFLRGETENGNETGRSERKARLPLAYGGAGCAGLIARPYPHMEMARPDADGTGRGGQSLLAGACRGSCPWE